VRTTLSRDKCLECLSSPFTYSCQTMCKTRDFLNLPKFIPYLLHVLILIQKLFWASDEGFKIALCVAPQTRYLHSIQIWRVSRCLLFIFNHLLTVLVEALLRDTYMHLGESSALSGSSRSVNCTLQ